MTARAAHRRPALRHRLRVIWDRLSTAVFFGLYRAAEVSPWVAMAHRDSEQHERRIEQLEHDVARLKEITRTCVHCIEGLTELTGGQL